MSQPPTIDSKPTIKWLNQLVMMAQWDRGKLPFQFVRLFSAPEKYQEFLARVRAGTSDYTDIPDEAVRTGREKLLEAISTWPSLKELFTGAEDPFAYATLHDLELLASMSDMTTDPQRMIYSRNGTLVAVVEALRQSQQLEQEQLIVDGLNNFFTLLETDEATAESLYKLAEEPYWYVVMASLRDGRDYTGNEDPIVSATLLEWQAKLTPELRALLFKPGHLSRAPIKLIKMAWNNKTLFEAGRASIPAAERQQNPIEERRQVVNQALPLFQSTAVLDYQELQADLNVFAIVGRHFIDVRKFAKLDGLVYTWPEIARLAMSNYPALEYVEDLLVNRKPPAETELDAREARELYELCSKKPALVRFLRLRPRFAEIDDDELRRYRPLAPVTISETTVKAAARGGSGAVEFVPPVATEAAPPVSPAGSLENCVLEITRDNESVPPTDPNTVNYVVALAGLGYTIAGHKISRSVEKVLEQVRSAIGVKSDSEVQSVLRDVFATSPTQAEARITRGGNVLLSQFLAPSMQAKLRDLLAANKPIRLVIRSAEREVHYLPWEWLPGLSPSQLLLSTREHSIVRQYAAPGEQTGGTLISPLTFMSIIPSPPVGQRFTSDITIRTLQSVIADQPVEYKGLIRSEATLENISSELESLQPKIVHLEGYLKAPTSDDEDEPIEIFIKSDQQFTFIESFGKLLKDNGVELLVVGRNSVAQMFQNLAARATFVLAREGPPVVMAPLRAIDDASATTFTTEFYRAFLQGNTLESAIQIARGKVVSKGGDWSAFALFADPKRLDHLQLLRESA